MLYKVTTYYLEMPHASDFKPKSGYKNKIEIKPISTDVFQHWMLFIGVGLPFRWYSRLKWSPEDWRKYLETSHLKTYMAFSNNHLVGYFELLFRENKEVELTFFGLFSNYIGTGLGGHLLSHALEQAWNGETKKVWLHTCTSDHKTAISNYIARGFKIINQTDEEEDIPEKEEYLKLVNNFMSQYIDRNNSFWI